MTTQEKLALWGQVYAAVIGGYVANPNHELNDGYEDKFNKRAKDYADTAVEAAEQVERKLKDGPPPSHFTRKAEDDF